MPPTSNSPRTGERDVRHAAYHTQALIEELRSKASVLYAHYAYTDRMKISLPLHARPAARYIMMVLHSVVKEVVVVRTLLGLVVIALLS